MNTYTKYCPNVFVAACDEQHSRGDIIEMTTARGKTHDCEVWNYLGQKSDGRHLYSITRCDGINHQTRAAARAQKYEDWATAAQQRSNDAYQRSEDAVAGIPFGQPILVGHHSESHHRAALKRSDAAMRKCVQESDKARSHEGKAEYWERKAEVIDLSMPESIEYFEAELAKAEEYHAGVKSGKYPRQHAYTLTYAKKAVNELREKVDIARKLWGDPDSTTAPDSQKTEPAPAQVQPEDPEPTAAQEPKSPATPATPSPIRKQVAEFKAKYPDKIILMRVGDFYEAFDQDAQTIADTLGLTLTKKWNDARQQYDLLAGLPQWALDQYLPRLVRAGHKVTICEELEAPKAAKVKEIVSPSGQKTTPDPDSQKNSVILQNNKNNNKTQSTMNNRQKAADNLVPYLTDEKIREYINASHFDYVGKWIVAKPNGIVYETVNPIDTAKNLDWELLEICTRDSYSCDCELCAPFKALVRIGNPDSMTKEQVKNFKDEYGVEPADLKDRTVLDLYNPEALAELIEDYRTRATEALANVPQGFFADEL